MPGQHGAGCGCAEAAKVDDSGTWLLPFINKEGVCAYNQDEDLPENAASQLFRPFDDRLNEEFLLKSIEGESEVVISIPFESPVQLTHIVIIGGENGHHPDKVKLFKGDGDDVLDHEDCQDREATQELELVCDHHGNIEYPVRAARFLNMQRLTLFFETNPVGGRTHLYWIGLKGHCKGHKRQAVNAVYESRAMMDDHEVPDDVKNTFNMQQ